MKRLAPDGRHLANLSRQILPNACTPPALRSLLESGETTIGEFIAMTCPDNPGNLHDQAWEVVDRLVEQMRKGTPS